MVAAWFKNGLTLWDENAEDLVFQGLHVMNLHKKYQPKEGYTRIVEHGEMGIAALDFGILNLKVGGSFFEDTADNEVVLIVLSGRCTLLVGHNGNKAHGIIGERADVFSDKAYRAYIPYRTTYELFADEVPVEVAICKVPSYLETAAVILKPGDELDTNDYGVTLSETPIQSICGEAICFYRFHPAEGCAHLHIYNTNRSFDQMVSIHHNDLLALPEGYHAEFMESSHCCYSLWMAYRDNA